MLGASKLILELAEAIQAQGHTCDVFPNKALEPTLSYTDAILQHLKSAANNYDVIELPDSLTKLPPPAPNYVTVLRSVLLEYHFAKITIPQRPLTWRNRLGQILKALGLRRPQPAISEQRLQFLDRLFSQASIINVANSMDAGAIRARNILQPKIVTLPYGIAAENRQRFDAVSAKVPSKPIIAFIGTFDFRKGCLDIITLAQELCSTYPTLSFRLLGTKGMLQTRDEVIRCFPRKLHSRLEVVPSYKPEQLPRLLSTCSFGIFPSYIEAFGIGVIEMLAAALPVIAYDSPGPCDILPQRFLAPPGNVTQLIDHCKLLLDDTKHLYKERQLAQQLSQQFNWKDIAQATINAYS